MVSSTTSTEEKIKDDKDGCNNPVADVAIPAVLRTQVPSTVCRIFVGPWFRLPHACLIECHFPSFFTSLDLQYFRAAAETYIALLESVQSSPVFSTCEFSYCNEDLQVTHVFSKYYDLRSGGIYSSTTGLSNIY